MKININSQPSECTIYMTEVCNFNCAGCRRQTVEKPQHKEVDLELLKNILLEYPTLKAFCIAGYGEPTLAKHFPEVVDYLLENDKYVGIITNGTYPERLLQLKKTPNYISISLYGFNNQQYKDYVGAGVFTKVTENFKKLKERFGNVGFSYFLNKDNYKNLDKILALCDELQPAFLNLANYLAYDSVETEDTRRIIRLTDIEIIRYIEDRISLRKYVNTRPIYLDEGDKEYECPSYKDIINLDGEGNIGGCQRQMPPSVIYGNVYNEADPYNNIQMQTMRKRINGEKYPHPNCVNCFGRHNPAKIWEKVDRLIGGDVDLAVMMLFHEKVEQTIECIKSFLPAGKKIYVLNNGSSKESVSKLRSFCKDFNQVKILDSDKNLGVSVGRNYLLQHTTEEWTFFVDNDIYITKNDWLKKFIVHMKNNKGVEVFVPRLFNLHENSFVTYHRWGLEGNRINYYIPQNGYMSNFPGGASIINRNVFARLGFYDSEMFVGFEDFEFAIRGLLKGNPVKAKLIDDIELVHDHRRITNTVDKNAVLVRYNEDSHQKSINRIQVKYPALDFQHEWQKWVREQKKKLIEQEEYDLFALTPEYNYGAKSKNRTITVKRNGVLEYELNEEIREDLKSFIKTGNAGRVIILQASENRERFGWLEAKEKPAVITLSDLTGFNILEKQGIKGADKKDELFIILDHLLEKMEDPRPVLKAVKKLLLLNKNNKAKIISKGRTKQGIEYPEDETSYREWKEEELKIHLSSGGFNILSSKNITAENESVLYLSVSVSEESYKKYLASLNLPAMDMYYLICSNEHGKAKLTGGIGSYVEEAQKLFKKEEIGVLLLSKGDMLPNREVIDKEKIITVDKFFDQQVISRNETAGMLLKCMQVVQYIYPYLNIVEVQDVEGFGYRLVQGKQSGMLQQDITVQMVAHGSKIYLENASQRWLPIINYDTIYKEKISLENADRTAFPTKFIKNLYLDAGYSFEEGKAFQLRLPFEFAHFPKNQYKEVDTLIFYGKRYGMKGYDVFSEIAALLDIEGFIETKIKRIVLIGPYFPEMTKQNAFFDSLKKRIEIIEVSLPRAEAIKLIKNLHSHSVCVLPYKSDNHPYSVLEIVETGCPFIFAKAGGIPELLPEKYHDKLLGALNCSNLAEQLKSVLSLPSGERYELYSSVFNEMNSAQKEINRKFVDFNRKQSARSAGKKDEVSASMIVLMNQDRNEYNDLLITAINSQTVLPCRLFIICIGDIDRETVKKSINEKILLEFSSYSDNYNKSKNNILKNIEKGIILVLAPSDIPKNDFVEQYLLFLQTWSRVQCVSSYADVIDKKRDIYDSSLISAPVQPLGEIGILDTNGSNLIALESAAFRTEFIKSIQGWEESSQSSDDLFSFIKIKSNNGIISVITKPLVIRTENKPFQPPQEIFPYQMRRAASSYSLDKFDTYRLIGMTLGAGFGRGMETYPELSDIEKYLVTVQTLLLNAKIYEAEELMKNIDPKILSKADAEVQKKFAAIKKKTEILIGKLKSAEKKKVSQDNNDPVISVIIPTYNRPEQLKETIGSVIVQTFKNYEIIIVNDAGEDVSGVVKGFNDGRIRYVSHQRNKGLAGARNTGMMNAKGKYIAFLDDDDIFYPNHLETLLANITKTKEKVVYADAYRCIQKKENGTYIAVNRELQYSYDYSRKILLIMNIAPVQCFLFDRSLLEGGVCFDESLTTHEDWEFWIKLSLQTDFTHIKEITSEYRHRVDNTNMVTTKLPDFLRTMKIIYERYPVNEAEDEEVVMHRKRRMQELEQQIKEQLIDRSASIVVVTYNSEKDINNCLKSLSFTLRSKDEVIIVDNHSADNTVATVKEFIKGKPAFRLIAGQENLGFSAGTNKGIKEAKNAYVIMLNPDTMVSGNWIDSLISHLEKNPNAGAAGPISNYAAGLQKMELYAKEKLKGSINFDSLYNSFKTWNNGKAVKTKILIGFCLIIRKSLIDEMEMLDERLFLGNDDLDLSWRLRLKNYKLLVAADTLVYHKGQQSFKTEKKTKTDELVQQSSDILYEKLADFYGEDNIPTPLELWGIDWFKPGNPKYNHLARLFDERKYRVSVVIPVFNQLEYTKQCLESMNNTIKEKVEVIVIDNASSDGTKEYLNNFKRERIRLKYIGNKENLGFPKAVNQGIKETRGDFVIIANNDIVFTNGWLEKMILPAENDSGIGIAGPVSNEVSGLQKDENAVYSTMDEMAEYSLKNSEINKGVTVVFPRLAFLCTLIKRKVIDAIGGLDERFSPGNYEDDDFCLRAQLAGFKGVIVKDVFIHHYGSKSFKADGIKKYSDRLEKNRNIFIDKWGATPDEIWLKNKTINGRQYSYPLNKNLYNEKVQRARINIADKEYKLALENIGEAVSLFDKYDEKDAALPLSSLFNLAGNISILIKDYEGGREYFERELELNPSSSAACVGLANIFFESKQYKEAKIMYEWGIKNDPSNAGSVEGLSRTNKLLDLPEDDNSLIEQDPEIKTIQEIVNDAYVFFEKNDLKGAVEFLESAEKKYDEKLFELNGIEEAAAFYNMKGFIYLGLKELENALPNFEKALNINEHSSQACVGLGEIFLLNNQIEAAKTMFEWGVKNNPQNEIAAEALSKIKVLFGGAEEEIQGK